jgi:hypothetical protein
MNQTKPRGGARKNTGLVQSVEAPKEVWQTLRTVLLARYGKADKDTVNAWFNGIVRQEWADYDAMIQKIADEMTELT